MSAAPQRGRSEHTRQKILRTAERLFAAEGVDTVTLRQIALASGQSNVSAVQYHFGGKEQLLDAILAKHLMALDLVRRAWMDDHEISGRPDDLESLLRILVTPLVEKLESATGRAYLLIQAQRNPADIPMPATKLLSARIRRSLGGKRIHPMADQLSVVLLFGALRDRALTIRPRSAASREHSDFADALVLALTGLLRGMSSAA